MRSALPFLAALDLGVGRPITQKNKKNPTGANIRKANLQLAKSTKFLEVLASAQPHATIAEEQDTIEAQLGLEKCHDYLLKHHWVHRRRQDGKCKSCGKSFPNKFNFYSKEIVAISCSWCKEAYHNKVSCFTLKLFEETCYMGTFSTLIIPPWWIIKAELPSNPVGSGRKTTTPRPSVAELNARIRKPSLTPLSTAAKTITGNGPGGMGAGHNRKKSSKRTKRAKCNSKLLAGDNLHKNDTVEQLSHPGIEDNQSLSENQKENLESIAENFGNDTTLLETRKSVSRKQSVQASKKLVKRSKRYNSKNLHNRKRAAPIFYIEPCQDYFYSPKKLLNGHVSANLEIMAEDYMKCGATPILVLINPKSGGNKGAKLIHKFEWFLNPRQVFDITKVKPQIIFELYNKVPSLRILVCGGDGTAGWIFTVLDEMSQKLSLPELPAVAILPLGTGNDLSRYLGWGGSYTDDPLHKILFSVVENPIRKLDRWDINVKPFLVPGLADAIDESSIATTSIDDCTFATSMNKSKHPANRVFKNFERSRTNPALISGGENESSVASTGSSLADSFSIFPSKNISVDGAISVTNLLCAQAASSPFGAMNFKPVSASQRSPGQPTSAKETRGINQLLSNMFVFPPDNSSKKDIEAVTTTKDDIDAMELQKLNDSGLTPLINAPVKSALPLNVFNNYFGLGSDAQVTLEFHLSREANPEKFNSRFKNKMFYAGVGGRDILKRSWKNLLNHVNLKCDDIDWTAKIRDMKFHCLLFLNISRYAGGTLPWGTDTSSAPTGTNTAANTSTGNANSSTGFGGSSSLSALSTAALLTKPFTSDKVSTAFGGTTAPSSTSHKEASSIISGNENLSSSAACGSSSGTFEKPRSDDGHLEVIGFTAASLAALQVGGHGYRICQCRKIRLVTTAEIPCQVDGEPCKLAPSIIEISLRNKANVVVNKRKYLIQDEPSALMEPNSLYPDAAQLEQIQPYIFDEENFEGDLEESQIEQFARDHHIQRYKPSVPTALSVSPEQLLLPTLSLEESHLTLSPRHSTAQFKQFEITEVEAEKPESASSLQTLSKVEINTKIITPKTTPKPESSKDGYENLPQVPIVARDIEVTAVEPVIDQTHVDILNQSALISAKDQDANQNDLSTKSSNHSNKLAATTNSLPTTANTYQSQPSRPLPRQGNKKLTNGFIPTYSKTYHAVITDPLKPSATSPNNTTNSNSLSEDDISNLDDDTLIQSAIRKNAQLKSQKQQQQLKNRHAPTITNNNESITRPKIKHTLAKSSAAFKGKHLTPLSPTPNHATTREGRWRNGHSYDRKPSRSPEYVPPEIIDTSFIDAAKIGNLEKMKILFYTKHANIMQLDPSNGMSALHYAAKGGFKNIVKFLLDEAPSDIIDIRDYEKNQTALHKAAWYCRRGISALLVERGALLDSKDYQGRIPRDLAKLAGDKELAEYLKPTPPVMSSVTPTKSANYLETLV